MALRIGAAPCSWGVEFADNPDNPPWQQVLDEAGQAGYSGIELGPVDYMPEDPEALGQALEARGLELIAGVVFRPFHDPDAWDEVLDGVTRTARSLAAHGAGRMVFIDSIAPARAPFAGRPNEAPRLQGTALDGLIDRLTAAARIGHEEYGLSVSLHAHAGGYIEFEDELDTVLDAVDENLLKICLDCGHCAYSGFDPVASYKRLARRIDYLHFKDVEPSVRESVVAEGIGFYDACARGVFCKLGRGTVDFEALKQAVEESGFSGWAAVEQDCDPAGETSPVADARCNLEFLRSAGLAEPFSGRFPVAEQT